MEKRLAVCNLCEAICGLEFTSYDGRALSGSRAIAPTRSRAATSARRPWR